MMKKNPQIPQETSTLLWESIEDHPAVVWLTENIKNVGYSLLGLLLILLLAARLGWIGSQGSEADFAKATNYFALFAKNPGSDAGKEALSGLSAIIKKHPELHAKYDGPIAQNLIIAGNGKEANLYLEKALKRTTDKNAPLYADFSRGTILITDNKINEALASATKLKEKLQITMLSDHSESTNFLFANTLLRIATLQQQLKNGEAEKEAWRELQTYITGPTGNAAAIQKFKSLFAQGSVGIKEYIDERLK